MCIWNIYIFFLAYEAEHIIAPALEEFRHALLAVAQEPAMPAAPAGQDWGTAFCGEGQVTSVLGLLFGRGDSEKPCAYGE